MRPRRIRSTAWPQNGITSERSSSHGRSDGSFSATDDHLTLISWIGFSGWILVGDRVNTHIQNMDPEENDTKRKQRATEVLEVEDEDRRQERMRKSLVRYPYASTKTKKSFR